MPSRMGSEPQLIWQLDFDDLNDFSQKEVQKKASAIGTTLFTAALGVGVVLHYIVFLFMYNFTVTGDLSFT